MSTIFVVQGEVKYDHTEILTAYTVKEEADAFVSTCEEYDKLEPKGHFGWYETDKPRYDSWRNAFEEWAKHHPAGENGKYFDYYEIKEVGLK